MHRLLLVGMNHTTAPLALRERMAFGPEQRASFLADFLQRFEQAEAVLLSTCNRVEFYAARALHGHPRVEEMIAFLAGQRHLAPEELEPHLYRKADRDAVEHLFSVACSLDSMVLGETQILGQVRQAYEEACAAHSIGVVLHPLLQRALSVGKQVMTQTRLAEGRVSIASVAVDYARRIFDRLDDKTILTIGTGKMGTLVLRSFQAMSPGRLLICSRSLQKSQLLADRFGGQPATLENLDEHLVAADIVISSTGAGQAIITRERFQVLLRRRLYRPVFMIDIALPRDIEPAVGELENVYLYNIDDLQRVVASTRNNRAGAIAEARDIIRAQVEEFSAWSRTRQVGPMIERLYQRYHSVAQEEVRRVIGKLAGLSEEHKSMLEDLGRRIVNKVLHDPVDVVRQSGRAPEKQGSYLHAMERLFRLTEQETQASGDNQREDEDSEKPA